MGLIQAKQVEGVIREDGSIPFTGDQSLGGNQITNMGDPLNPQDATTKAYVDALAMGLSWKDSVIRASSTNVVIATGTRIGDVFDGTALVAGDRILLYGQTTVAENGIYVVSSVAATPASRAEDADAPLELRGAAVLVESGTDENRAFTQNADGTTFATVSTWVVFSSISATTAGDALSEAGGVLNVNAGDGINLTVPTADAVNVDVSAIVGSGLENDGSNNLRVRPDVSAQGASISVGANGVKAPVPSRDNKNQAIVNASAGVNLDTGLAIVGTPAGDGHVWVTLNGVEYAVGGSAAGFPFYYRDAANTVTRAIADIVATDKLWFNPTAAGFDVAITDVASQFYSVFI